MSYVFIFLFSLMKKETKKSLKAKGGCFAPFVSSLHAFFQHLLLINRVDDAENAIPLETHYRYLPSIALLQSALESLK